MPNVTKMHTMKNDDGSATEVYYGVKNAKYIEVIPGRTLDKELLDIHATIAKNLSDLTTSIESTNSSLNSNINSLNTALTSRIDEVNATLGQRITDLNEDLGEVSTQVNTNKNDIASLGTKTDTTDANVSSLTGRVTILEGLDIASRLSVLESSLGVLETTVGNLVTRVEALENSNVTS